MRHAKKQFLVDLLCVSKVLYLKNLFLSIIYVIISGSMG